MGAVADVQAHLASAGLVDGATGWASVRRRLNDDKGDQQVVLTEDGGPTPQIGRATGIGDVAWSDAGVHVLVRASRWDSDASEAKATAIRDELHGKLDEAMNGTTYLRVRAMTKEPVFAGFDDSGRPQHTIAFRLAVEEN